MQKNKMLVSVMMMGIVVLLFFVVGVLERDMAVVEEPVPPVMLFESNGVEYELKGFLRDEDFPMMQGCVRVPDLRGWVPVVRLENETTGESSEMGKYTEVTDPTSDDERWVCHEIVFYDTAVGSGDVVRLVVMELVHALDLVDVSDFAKVKATVVAEYPGLDFMMVVENNVGSGGIGFRITENPNEVTDAEVNAAINAAAMETIPLNIEILLDE